MDALNEWVKGINLTEILDWLMFAAAALIAISVHESSHALSACWLGDDTAKRMGRVSLNPLRHLDVVGFLMMVFAHFGWARPVPVNMYRFKNPKRGMAITALAGPASNVLITVVFLLLYGALYIPLRSGAAGRYFLEMLELTAYISLSFAVFNILPLPPLDGSKVLFSLMSDEGYVKLMRYERYGSILLLVLVSSGIFGRPLSAATNWAFDKLFIFAEWGYELVGAIH